MVPMPESAVSAESSFEARLVAVRYAARDVNTYEFARPDGATLMDVEPGAHIDVALPNEGVRGIEACRDTWPPFFQWQASGAVFQIESLDVTAGAEVAFAYALLRCGSPADFAQHARINALPHLDNYQGRAITN